jgi:hypothetical protein
MTEVFLAVKIHKASFEDVENKWQSRFKTLQNSVPTAKKTYLRYKKLCDNRAYVHGSFFLRTKQNA